MSEEFDWLSRLGRYLPISLGMRGVRRVRKALKTRFSKEEKIPENVVEEVVTGRPQISLPWPVADYDTWKYRGGPPLERYYRGQESPYVFDKGEVFARPSSYPLALNPTYERPTHPLHPLDSIPGRPLPNDQGDEEMHPATVMAVVAWIGANLSHIPHTVCGLSAMVMYGYTARRARHVTILFPGHTHGVVRSWAATKGVETYPNTKYEFGVRLPNDGDKVRRVRVRFTTSETFLRLPHTIVNGADFGEHGARILGLSALINYSAKSYMETRGGPRAMAAQMQTAQDLTWLVHRLIVLHRTVAPEEMPHFYNPLFLDPFECTFPDARELFVEARLLPGEGISGGSRPVSSTSIDSGFMNYIRYNDFVKGQKRSNRLSKKLRTKPTSIAASRPQPQERVSHGRIEEGESSMAGHTGNPEDKGLIGPVPVSAMFRTTFDDGIDDLPLSRWAEPMVKPGPFAGVSREWAL